MGYTGSYFFSFDGVPETTIRPILSYEVVQEPERNSSVVYLTLQFRTRGDSDLYLYGMNIANSTLEVESIKRSSMDNLFGPMGNHQTKTIQTLAVRVFHDANGWRSARIKAHGIVFSSFGSIDFSIERIINLPQIIVKPTITSIRFNSDLVYNQPNSIVYSLSVPPDSKNNFDISLIDNNISRLDYENVSSGSNQVLTITADEVNTLIGLMAGSRNKAFKVSVYEWDPSGSGGVISSSEINITATTEPIINADNIPTVSVNGNGIDSQMGLYIQNITRVDFDLKPQLNSGATLASATTTIERVEGGFSQTINSATGTSNVLTQAGTYNISGIVVDNKGIRMRSKTTQFTVTAYSPPSVNSFQVQRQEREVTTANVTVSTSHNRISGNNITNRLQVSVQRKNEQGEWVNVANFSDDLGANENGQIYTTTVLNNNESLSYDYRVVITDSFSRTTESIITLPAGKIVLDIHKNLGVGIGKYHEQGALDVEGKSYFLGDMSLTGGGFYNGTVTENNKLQTKSEVDTAISTAVGSIDLSDYVKSTTLDTKLGDYVKSTTLTSTLNSYVKSTALNSYVTSNALNLTLGDYAKTDNVWAYVLSMGTNTNGRWIRFNDGTQICWFYGLASTDSNGNFTQIGTSTNGLYRSSNIDWTFPKSFSSDVAIFGMARLWSVWATTNGQSNSTGTFVQWATSSRNTVRMNVMAIGRW